MDIKRPPKPDLKWLSLHTWHNTYDLSQNLATFRTLCDDIQTRPISIQIADLLVNVNPSNLFDSSLDAMQYQANLTEFDKLVLVKNFAEDKVVQAVTLFVAKNLGQSFVESPPTDLNTLYKDMSNKIPLVFILSTGSDPMGGFLRFAKEQGIFCLLFLIDFYVFLK